MLRMLVTYRRGVTCYEFIPYLYIYIVNHYDIQLFLLAQHSETVPICSKAVEFNNETCKVPETISFNTTENRIINGSSRLQEGVVGIRPYFFIFYHPVLLFHIYLKCTKIHTVRIIYVRSCTSFLLHVRSIRIRTQLFVNKFLLNYNCFGS